MSWGTIIFCLGWGGVLLSTTMLIPIGWAVFQAENIYVGRFVISLMISSFISVAFILVGKSHPLSTHDCHYTFIENIWILSTRCIATSLDPMTD